jgi:hypothetical protein
MRRSSMRCLGVGWRPRRAAFGAGHGQALSGTHAQQIDFELGEGSQDVEEHLAHRIVRVIDVPAERQLDTSGRQIVTDRPHIRDRVGQPVEFRHDEDVTGADRRERLIQPGR